MVLNFIMASGCNAAFSRNLDFTYRRIWHMNPAYEVSVDVVSSIDDLRKFKDQMIEDYMDQMESIFGDVFTRVPPSDVFRGALDDYTEDFFEENYLVLVSFSDGSVCINHRVERVRANGYIRIAYIIPPRGYPLLAAGAQWLIIIELSNDYIPEEFNVNFVRRQERRN